MLTFQSFINEANLPKVEPETVIVVDYNMMSAYDQECEYLPWAKKLKLALVDPELNDPKTASKIDLTPEEQTVYIQKHGKRNYLLNKMFKRDVPPIQVQDNEELQSIFILDFIRRFKQLAKNNQHLWLFRNEEYGSSDTWNFLICSESFIKYLVLKLDFKNRCNIFFNNAQEVQPYVDKYIFEWNGDFNFPITQVCVPSYGYNGHMAAGLNPNTSYKNIKIPSAFQRLD